MEKRDELIEAVGNEDEKLAEWMIENDYPNNAPPLELLLVNCICCFIEYLFFV